MSDGLSCNVWLWEDVAGIQLCDSRFKENVFESRAKGKHGFTAPKTCHAMALAALGHSQGCHYQARRRDSIRAAPA